MTQATARSDRPSMAAAQEEIIEEMAGLDDPLDRYAYLVDLGKAMEVRDDAIRQEVFSVPGCQSQVWIRTELRGGRLRIHADAEAMITRGIVALLLRVLDDRPPAEIADADLFFLRRTGLETHLSPSRANGLATMVRQIRTYAEEASRG